VKAVQSDVVPLAGAPAQAQKISVVADRVLEFIDQNFEKRAARDRRTSS